MELKFSDKQKNIIKTLLYTLLTTSYILFIGFYKFPIIITAGSLTGRVYAGMFRSLPTTFIINLFFITSVLLLFGGLIMLVVSIIKTQSKFRLITFGLLIASQLLFNIYVIDQTNMLSYSIDSFFYLETLIIAIIVYGIILIIHLKNAKK